MQISICSHCYEAFLTVYPCMYPEIQIPTTRYALTLHCAIVMQAIIRIFLSFFDVRSQTDQSPVLVYYLSCSCFRPSVIHLHFYRCLNFSLPCLLSSLPRSILKIISMKMRPAVYKGACQVVFFTLFLINNSMPHMFLRITY